MIKRNPIFMQIDDNTLTNFFKEQLKNKVISSRSMTFDLNSLIDNMCKDTPIPSVKFTAEAYTKMMALIDGIDKEIAWHGIVEQMPHPTNESQTVYLVTDIICYPQTVTGTTVDTDPEGYNKWICSLDNETANSVRLQGHSHVNMGVTPSGRDTGYYEEMLLQIRSYYIFIIVNKARKMYIRFYDVKNNTMFELDEHDGIIFNDGSSLSTFTTESLALVKSWQAPVRDISLSGSQYPSPGSTGNYYAYMGRNMEPVVDPRINSDSSDTTERHPSLSQAQIELDDEDYYRIKFETISVDLNRVHTVEFPVRALDTIALKKDFVDWFRHEFDAPKSLASKAIDALMHSASQLPTYYIYIASDKRSKNNFVGSNTLPFKAQMATKDYYRLTLV